MLYIGYRFSRKILFYGSYFPAKNTFRNGKNVDWKLVENRLVNDKTKVH